jgi:DNA-binding XRE family transcriptional regulator
MTRTSFKPTSPPDSSDAPRVHRGASVYDSKQIDFYKYLGRKVKIIRQQVGLTQTEVARRAGLDRAYLSQIEAGKRHLSLYLAYRIAQTLGVSLDSLIDLPRGDPNI